VQRYEPIVAAGPPALDRVRGRSIDYHAMLSRLSIALVLMAVCVVIHAAGVSWALRKLRPSREPAPRLAAGMQLFVLVAAWIILLHLAEIAVWAGFYLWQDAMPDLASALYFSAVTYTTTGYGDLVLAEEWRLLGAVEALTGILMCGWSTGFFFAIVNRIYEGYR
jgi:voltage-gated potassium channel Kch